MAWAASPDYLSPGAVRGTIGADRPGYGQLCLENSLSGWDDWAAIRHVLFERGGLAPLYFMAKLAALVPKPRTNLTGPPLCPWVQARFHGVLSRGGLPSTSRYRESVTAQSVRKVEPASADVEADGREEPNPGAGRRKGLCCTQGRPAKRLKRVFNGAAFMPLGAGIDVSVCSACGAAMKIIVGMPNHSIEDPTVIGKLLSHLETTSCPPPAGLAWCAVGARAPPPGSC